MVELLSSASTPCKMETSLLSRNWSFEMICPPNFVFGLVLIFIMIVNFHCEYPMGKSLAVPLGLTTVFLFNVGTSVLSSDVMSELGNGNPLTSNVTLELEIVSQISTYDYVVMLTMSFIVGIVITYFIDIFMLMEYVPESSADDEESFDEKLYVSDKRKFEFETKLRPLNNREFRELNGRYGRLNSRERDVIKIAWSNKSFVTHLRTHVLMRRLWISSKLMISKWETRLYVVPENGVSLTSLMDIFDTFATNHDLCELADMMRHLIALVYVKDDPILVMDRMLSIKIAYSRCVKPEISSMDLFAWQPESGLFEEFKYYAAFREAPMLGEFMNLLRNIVGYTYRGVPKETMNSVFSEALTAFDDAKSLPNLALNSVNFFIRLGDLIVKVLSGASVRDVLLVSKVARWKNDVDEILAKVRLGMSHEIDMSDSKKVQEHITKLDTLKDQGIAFQLGKSNPLVNETLSVLDDLLESLKFSLNPKRRVPVGYLLTGPPGTGKTITMDEIHYNTQIYRKVDPSISIAVSYDETSKFQSWPNLDPKVIYLNDCFSTIEGTTSALSTVQMFQKMIDSDGLMIPEAEAHLKKYGWRRPDVVVGSTNVNSYQAVTQTAPEKLIRRVIVINTTFTDEAKEYAEQHDIPIGRLMELCDPAETDHFIKYKFYTIKKEGKNTLNFNGNETMFPDGSPMEFTSRLIFLKYLRNTQLDLLKQKEEQFATMSSRKRCINGMAEPHNPWACGCRDQVLNPESGLAMIGVSAYHTMRLTIYAAMLCMAPVYYGVSVLPFCFLSLFTVYLSEHEEKVIYQPIKESNIADVIRGTGRSISEWYRYQPSVKERCVLFSIGLLKYPTFNRFVCFMFPACSYVKERKYVMGAIASLGTFLVLAKLLQIALRPEGGFIGTLKFKKDLPENYVSYPAKSPTYFGGSAAIINNNLYHHQSNVVKIRRGYGEFVMGVRITHCLILAPYHIFFKKDLYPDYSSGSPNILPGEKVSILHNEHETVYTYSKETLYDAKNDWCLIFVPGFTYPNEDLRNQFRSKIHPALAVGQFKGFKLAISSAPITVKDRTIDCYMSVGAETTAGDCGTILCDDEAKILGIHIAKQNSLTSKVAVAAKIYTEDIETGLEEFRKRGFPLDPWVADSLFVPESQGFQPGLHPRSDAGWLSANGFQFCANILGHSPMNYTTTFSGRETVLAPHFKDRIPEYVLPTKFKAHPNSAGVYVGPYVNKCREMIASPHGTVDMSLAMRAIDLMMETFPQGELATHPLTLAQSIMGVVGDPMAKRRPEKSVGSACKRAGITNANLIEVVSEQEGLIHPKFEEMCHFLLEACETTVPSTFGRGVIKEEYVKKESWDEKGKLRIFVVNDLAYNVVLKSHIVPLIAASMRHMEWSGVAGLVNAGSKDWKRLYEHLGGGECDTILESDHKAFDSHHRTLIIAYAILVYRLASKLGYTEKEAHITANLVLAGFNQVFEMEGNFYQLSTMLASGRSDTLFANSIIHRLIYVMALIKYHDEKRMALEPVKVADIMRTAFVGDDCLAQMFNLPGLDSLYMQKFCHELGYVLTSANKNAELEPSVPMKDATFLKRKFVVDGERIFAPLSKESIYKSICYRIDSKASDEEHLKSVLESSQREMFLHGKDDFLKFQGELKALGYESSLLQYDNLLASFDADEFSTWAAVSYVFSPEDAAFFVARS